MPMTISESRDHEGARVCYQPDEGEPEFGTITGFSTLAYVFVRYDGELTSKATLPVHLSLIVGE